MNKEDAFKSARSLFNQEKYWGTHEVLESVWKNLNGDERDLVNGIILIAKRHLYMLKKTNRRFIFQYMKRAVQKPVKIGRFWRVLWDRYVQA